MTSYQLESWHQIKSLLILGCARGVQRSLHFSNCTSPADVKSVLHFDRWRALLLESVFFHLIKALCVCWIRNVEEEGASSSICIPTKSCLVKSWSQIIPWLQVKPSIVLHHFSLQNHISLSLFSCRVNLWGVLRSTDEYCSQSFWFYLHFSLFLSYTQIMNQIKSWNPTWSWNQITKRNVFIWAVTLEKGPYVARPTGFPETGNQMQETGNQLQMHARRSQSQYVAPDKNDISREWEKVLWSDFLHFFSGHFIFAKM